MIDFTKLGNASSSTKIEARDIFMSLPARGKRYEYPRDVQSEVWKQWYENRNQDTTIIKMNTGSGKTVVGLLILKSCLHEGKGPAVYVVPDNFLVNQVCQEADALGISTVRDPEDISFTRKQSILVITIQALVNGKSKFGMRSSNNISIGSILIDDVHACLSKIEEQYRVVIPADDPLYETLIELFSETLIAQSENKYSDIVDNQDPVVNMLVPYWTWQSKQREVYTLLSQNTGKNYIDFNFPLIKDCLSLCSCMVSAKQIEISPPCIPIHKITSFTHATRKIYMSATLADDSTFVTALDVNHERIGKIISPEKANDIGDRLILFPQVMNKNVSDTDIKKHLVAISKQSNVVVIVPSNYRAQFWSDSADLVLNANNITDGVAKLKAGYIGLVVLINKYDGIDLPEDACRLLVIDGLPQMRSLYDCFEQNATPLSSRLCSEQIQKIEQGMGRGVRSNTDFCVVVLMGRALADTIYTANGFDYFSDATKAQYLLSEQLWEQLGSSPKIEEIFELASYSLKRDMGWVTVSKETLSSVKYSSEPRFNSETITRRKAFNQAELSLYTDAVNILEQEKNKVSDKELRGLLKQCMAEYMNFYNPSEAQQLQLSARTDNRMVLCPIRGIQFDKITNKTGNQAQSLITYLAENNITANKYILKIHSVVEQLIFAPDTAKTFERALEELSFLLGIFSNRPEDEYGKGPDNFWDTGNSTFLVIECKNGTITDTICKHDCNQLNGSINWFDLNYPSGSCQCTPIMIHNSRVFEFACSPNEKIRIMTPDLLEKFKGNILSFAENLTLPDAYTNPVRIHQLLSQFNLLGAQIPTAYTTTYQISRS